MGRSCRRIAERPSEPLGVRVDRDVPYTSQLATDVFYPSAAGPWPVAVVLHGGEDHKATMSGFARAAAEFGIVAFVPEWRSFPAQLEEHRAAAMEDVACAIRFARDRSGNYGGDGKRIVMAGWSLGGNFAAIAALREEPVGGDCAVDADTDEVVQGVVGLDGAYDFTEILLASDRPPSWTLEEMSEISAHSYVRATERYDRPIFRLFTGSIPQLHAQAERFKDGLSQAGFDVELVRAPSLSHDDVILAPGTIDALAGLAFG